MKLKVFQKGFNYSQDGQGNRLIFHLQGCNMKCPWCSNPEGMPLKGALVVNKDWLNESCCPKGAVIEGVLDRTRCESCEEMPCAKRRRQKGIQLSYKEYEVDELVTECISSKSMFFDGGGVTLTGGEVTMQFDAVKELLEKLGEAGIHRAIETNGTHPRSSELIPLVEQWIMDIKHYDDEKHTAWLGVSNRWIVENLKTISALHPNMLVRVPLIPGFNDNLEDAKGFAALFKESMDCEKTRVEFLTYHEFGKGKWEQCGMEYKMAGGRISAATLKHFETLMKESGVQCVRT